MMPPAGRPPAEKNECRRGGRSGARIDSRCAMDTPPLIAPRSEAIAEESKERKEMNAVAVPTS